MRGLFALMLAGCFLNLVGLDLRADGGTPKPNPSKFIVFLNRASFHCCHGGLPASPGGRPPVMIYPDMTIEFDSQGNYSVSFAVESPQSDVLLNLELLIPYSLPVESLKPSELVEGPPPTPTASEPKKEQSEALVVVPPIRIPANKVEKPSETTQYFIKQVWARGNSAALARAYPMGKQTTFVPISDKPSADLPRRSGTATVGTIVK